MSELLGDVEGLPEEEPVFQSSGVAFEVKADDGHPMIRMIGIFVFVICGLGVANGLDFINPDAGLVRPHEWINGMAKGAPYDSAEFSGTVFSDGEPVVGADIFLVTKINERLNKNEVTQTDDDGKFSFSEVTPGLTKITIIRSNTANESDAVIHRIILNPPSPLESKGYTNINFQLPEPSEFDGKDCNDESNDSCIRLIDYSDEEMEFPLIDESAAGLYVTIGWGMIGLALIASGFAFYGIKNSSRGLIQTSCVLVFFTAGHFYSACVFSLMAFALTFTIPRKSHILEA